MPSNRNLHKLLRVVFPEVLMEYFEISGWYDKATGETFSHTYDDLTAEGTKLTPELVAFLKE